MLLIPICLFRSGLDITNFISDYIPLLKIDFIYDLFTNVLSKMNVLFTSGSFVDLLMAYFSYLFFALLLDICFDVITFIFNLADNMFERWFG